MKHPIFRIASCKPLAAATVALIISLMLAPAAWAINNYKTLYTFAGGVDGASPSASLVLDQAGNLYGTTKYGGQTAPNPRGNGTVFKLTPNGNGSWAKTELYAFNWDGKDGIVPNAGLVFDHAGNLYGTTSGGGAYGDDFGGWGTVFKLAPNADGTWTESILYSFKQDGADGYWPVSSLIFDPAGRLYGATDHGGGLDDGTIFKLSPNPDGTWSESIIHSFSWWDGSYIDAGLIFDAAGNLYGTAAGGGVDGYGTVFKLSSNRDGSWSLSVLHSFLSDGTDGYIPYAGLTLGRAGALYGTTAYGTAGAGSWGGGTVFTMRPAANGGWQERVLHSFQGGDGFTPYGNLVIDAAGSLYGTTAGGGAYGFGAIFKLIPVKGGWKQVLLHSFKNYPGAYPYSGLTLDSAGNLYGTTAGDGATTSGSVFQITP